MLNSKSITMPERTVILDADTLELGVPEVVRGTALALNSIQDSLDVVLVGSEVGEAKALITKVLMPVAGRCGCKVEIQPTKDKIPERVESPVQIYRSLPDNPISIGLKLLKERGGAFISAGNTGLVMTTALFILGRMKNVERPPIATPLPTRKKTLFFLDAGANVDVRAYHLHQFARLGRVYVESIFGRKNPKIGLLSNGTEDYKGNAVVREAYLRMKADETLNFVGFVEGHDLTQGELDLMVCDGFIGNILLKFAEGLAQSIYRVLLSEIRANAISALAARLFLSQSFARAKKRLDYSEWGGAPLLGVRGNVVICHGRSHANAIKNAFLFAVKMIDKDISARLEAEMEGFPDTI